MAAVELLAEIWSRVTARQVVPPSSQVLLSAAAALAAVILAWRLVRILTTVVHEAGHAVVAMLVGRRLQGIRLHSDTSGLTVSKGRPRGPGMIATLLAGYPAPAIFGLVAAWVLSQGYAVALLWGSLLVLALMVLWIRNFYGLLVIAVLGVGIGLASWYLQPADQSLIAFMLTWLLLLSAPRASMELLRRPSANSDAGQLARLTRVPAGVWSTVFVGIGLFALVVGTAMLLPQVVMR
ncbi:M50 family metallopeptidase [Naumannella halotolerans]|uniref:M50 family metallopeptidase n=1 Tax=Naumannella halotolerans TaxID=993414 RepID=UPI00370D0A37